MKENNMKGELYKSYYSCLEVILACVVVLTLICPAVAAEWKFAYMSDNKDANDSSGVNMAAVNRIAADMKNQGVSLVLVGGDLIDGRGLDTAGLNNQYGKWIEAMKPLYDVNIPVYSVPGNHEYWCDVDSSCVEAWTQKIEPVLPAGRTDDTSRPGRQYSFNFNNALFIGLDQNKFEYGEPPHYYRGNDMDWINDRLSANDPAKQPHIIAFGHMPQFMLQYDWTVAAYKSNREAFWTALGNAGSRMYFTGHSHTYALAYATTESRQGALYQILAGSAGAGFEKPGWDGVYKESDRASGRDRNNDYEGYSLVTIDGLYVKMTWRYYDPAVGSFQERSGFSYSLATGAPVAWGSDKIAALYSDYGSDNGIWSHDGSSWKRLTDWQPGQMIGYGSSGMAANFNSYGIDNGIWKYDGATWARITDWTPRDMISYGSGNLAGKFSDYGAGNGIYKYTGSSWGKLTDWLPDSMVSLNDDELIGLFSQYGDGNGVWKYDGAAWTRITDWIPEGIKAWGSRLAATFTNYGSGNGLWIYEGSAWRRATDWTPTKVLSWKNDAQLAGIFSDYASGNGIWNYDGAAWSKLTDWVPVDMTKLGTNDLIAVFKEYGASGNGVWKYSGADKSWQRISDWVPATISSSGDYIVGVFKDYGSAGNGVWKYQGGSWSRISDWLPREP